MFARVLGVKRWLANSYNYAIGNNVSLKKKKKKRATEKVNYTSTSHKGIRGKRGIVPLILYLRAKWEWSKSNPAALPPYPLNKGLSQVGLDVFRKEHILYPDRIGALDRPARSLVAIHTTLPQLPLIGVNTHLNICH